MCLLTRITLNSGVLYVNIVGSVNRIFVDKVISTLVEAYSVLGESPELVELYIYESSDIERRALLSEAVELGISVLGEYPVSHDAWMGWPRVRVNYEECRDLGEDYLRALLYHEAVHSILHGSIASYVVSIKGLTQLEVVYLASVVVKDIEVHEYLASRGLLNILSDYFEYTRSSIRDIECSSLRGLLEVAKLISPCLIMNCNLAEKDLHSTCRDVYGKLLGILDTVRRVRGDLNFKILELLERVTSVVNTKSSVV